MKIKITRISAMLFVALALLAWAGTARASEIHDSARAGDLEKVKALLNENPGLIRVRDQFGSQPLHFAESKEMVELLLAKGANVQAENFGRQTPLHFAAMEGNTEVLEVLLNKGADVNFQDRFRMTPLHYAAMNGRKRAVTILLAHKADANARDGDGRTALDLASEKHHDDVAEVLRSSGGGQGNPQVIDFDRSFETGNMERVKALVEENPNLVNTENIYGRTPLIVAAIEGQKRVVEFLLAHKTDANAKGSDGWTSLHWATVRGHKEVMQVLLANKADVNARDGDGRTPLHVAATGGDEGVAELLLANKADVNAKDKYGKTPLHRAADAGTKAEVVEVLLNHKAEMNAKDNNGNTPLDLSRFNSNVEVVEALKHPGQTGGPKITESVAELVLALQKEPFWSGKERAKAAWALTKTGDRSAVQGLRMALYDPDEATRTYAKEAMKRLGQPVAEDLQKEGKLDEAFSGYLADLRTIASYAGRPLTGLQEWRVWILLPKVCELGAGMSLRPAIPEEATRNFMKANTFLKAAKEPSDYKYAIDAYEEALLDAPWWGDASFNLGVALEAAGRYDDAKRSMKLYLFTKPGQTDAAQAQNKIYEIEAKQELENKKKAERPSVVDSGATDYKDGNYATALEKFRKVAEQGQPEDIATLIAESNLGVMYEKGQGVTQDYAEAAKWFRKAAEKGYAPAQNSLGVAYDNGQGVTRDYDEAVKWYRKAVEQGNANAMWNLGICYEEGKGVGQDRSEALNYYRKAAQKGSKLAQEELRKLGQKW